MAEAGELCSDLLYTIDNQKEIGSHYHTLQCGAILVIYSALLFSSEDSAWCTHANVSHCPF